MNKGTSLFLAGMLTVVLGLAVGCDWSSSSNDDSFNTSQGGGSTVNVSGFYEGALAGGQAVSSGTSIRNFTVVQSGNAVDIYDSNGSHYSGNIGSPGAVAEANDSGVYPAGAELVQYQISFSGYDVVAQRDVEFVGVIHLVSVSDIQGDSTSYTVTTETGKGSTNYTSRGSGSTNTVTDSSGSTNSVSDTDTYSDKIETIVTTSTLDSNPGLKKTTTTTTIDQVDPATGTTTEIKIEDVVVVDTTTGEEVYSATTTNITDTVNDDRERTDTSTSSDSESEEEVSSSSSSKGSDSSSSSSLTTVEEVKETKSYSITEATSQLRLEGTWMFSNGGTAQVDAIGPGAGGTITESTTTTTETPAE